jgi:hypothetical protein
VIEDTRPGVKSKASTKFIERVWDIMKELSQRRPKYRR